MEAFILGHFFVSFTLTFCLLSSFSLGFKPKAITSFMPSQFVRSLHAENENFQLPGEGGIRLSAGVQQCRAQAILFLAIVTQKVRLPTYVHLPIRSASSLWRVIFKARRKFFARQFHQADIEYIARQIGVGPADVHVGIYSKGTYARHQSIILNYFGCNSFDEPAKRFIASEIATLVRVQYRPKLVLMEALQILTRQKIEIPSYNVLAGLILTSINHHRSELSAIVEADLSKKQRPSHDALLEKRARQVDE